MKQDCGDRHASLRAGAAHLTRAVAHSPDPPASPWAASSARLRALIVGADRWPSPGEVERVVSAHLAGEAEYSEFAWAYGEYFREIAQFDRAIAEERERWIAEPLRRARAARARNRRALLDVIRDRLAEIGVHSHWWQ